MLSPDNQPPTSASSAFDQRSDFHHYRERAHRERTKAINMAVAMIWSRMTGRQLRLKRDAAFWTA